jgi:predicted kinase
VIFEDSQSSSDVQLLTESLGQLPEPVAKPVFIVVSGLPGTGKSYLCGKIAERLPVVVLESDILRKLLFASPNYNPTESSRLFRAIHFLIRRLLEKGISLILDATNLSESYRERLYSIADRLDSRLILVRVEAPPEVVKERLRVRTTNQDGNSDADWEIYKKMKPTVQRIRRMHYAVDTSHDVTPALDKIIREAKR